ncbi:hypothetical protein BDF14DRAFT_1790388 [Spinellus fusiger]|nr:hypothetical protein BDF14DRAFT_1790388 [Spinellus fusiger]
MVKSVLVFMLALISLASAENKIKFTYPVANSTVLYGVNTSILWESLVGKFKGHNIGDLALSYTDSVTGQSGLKRIERVNLNKGRVEVKHWHFSGRDDYSLQMFIHYGKNEEKIGESDTFRITKL